MFNLLDRRPTNVKNDILSGITVALALVPEAVAFAFIAGVEPMVGLQRRLRRCMARWPTTTVMPT